jgi:hypothetical protein
VRQPRSLPIVASCLLALVAVVAASTSTREAIAADAGAAPSLPACVQITASSRYVPYGYNHIVSVKNGCSKLAVCAVRTDVSPELIAVEVAPGVTSEVVTFVASPSQTFTPLVTCALK